MAHKVKLSYVLPTFNEIENLGFIFNQIKYLEKNNDLEFIFIDDNSTDGTFDYISNQKNKFNNMRLYKRLYDKGLSKAIIAGFLIAKGEYVVVMDTDGQHEIKTTLNLFNKIEGEKLDIVIASRFLQKSQIENFSIMRLYFSKFGNFLSRMSLSSKYSFLTDYMSGCFILRKQTCQKFIKEMKPNGFKFLYGLLNQCDGNLEVCEFPYHFKKRRYGKSKLDFFTFFIFIISLITYFFSNWIKIIIFNLSKIYKQYLNKK